MSLSDDNQDNPNRRKHERRLVCIPAYANTLEATERIALIRDISVSGARFLTRTTFEPGDRIAFTLHLTGDPDGPSHEITADVVRVEARDPEQAGIWAYAVAVRFDIPADELKEDIERLAALLAEKYPE